MQVNVINLSSDPASQELLNFLQENEIVLGLTKSQVYYDFPLYKDEEGNTISASILLVSPNHGVVAFAVSSVTDRQDVQDEISRADAELGKVLSALISSLIRHKGLQKSRTELLFSVTGCIYAPSIVTVPSDISTEFQVLTSCPGLPSLLEQISQEELTEETLAEVVSVIEGSKGLVRPKARNVQDTSATSKGNLANQIERSILVFDRQQKRSSIAASFDGPQRVRGLAGSGKTVILALKAALTHLRYPDATIVYTFYTRSLYQHIRRLITRFYRQYDDQDPDWSRLQVLHAWGGQTAEGVYYNACIEHGVTPLTFSQARLESPNAPFDYACRSLINSARLRPLYDYVFVDEGQDFPASFINLCVRIAKERRVVWAYDDLQTIFQPHAPTPEEVFGTDAAGNPRVELNLDTVLYKCYRNPREVIVTAHALGFGIYGRIVQMLENKEHWEDIGYLVRKGDFIEGSDTIIERPIENSLPFISEVYQAREIVKANVYTDFAEEVSSVSAQIAQDLADGLRPDDILVVVADDRYASNYLGALSDRLTMLDIRSNNVHADSFGIRDFQREGHVTLSTVHKAKGNEAYMVYAIGVDALFSSYAGVRERNMLFTAMTRAKGWLRVSGIGTWASACKEEVDTALRNFPYLKFQYPSEEELKIMKRDLTEKGIRKLKNERLLEQVMQEMDAEEIARFVEQRSIRKVVS